MSFIFSRISRQNKTMSNTFKNCQTRLLDRNARVSDLGDFWTTLKNQLANTPPTLETSSIRLVVTGRARNALSHVEQGKSARQHVWGTQNAMRLASLGSLFGKRQNQYQYKGKAQKSNQYKENEGNAERFRRKNGEIRHIHIRRKGKIERGKLWTPEKQHVRLETRTQGQFDIDAVCTNTNALRLPLILIRKVFRHSKKSSKVSSKAYITTRPAKHIHSENKSREQKQQKLSGQRKLRPSQQPPWHFWRSLFVVVVVHSEEWMELSTERKLPEKYWKRKQRLLFLRVDRCFVGIPLLPPKQTDRSHILINTHTRTHTSTQRNKPQTYASLQFSFHFAISI